MAMEFKGVHIYGITGRKYRLCSQFAAGITTFFLQFRVSEMYLDGEV
jgi:hypothetical protein